MVIYFIPLMLAFSSLILRTRALEHLAILFAGVLLLIRDRVGYDYDNYVRIFEEDISFSFAPLADILQDTARFLMVPNGFMGIAAITSTALLFYLSRSSATPRLSVLVFMAFPFFFLESFTTVRQMLAVLFTALCYQELKRQRMVTSVIAVLIAIGIHPSAAVSLPLFMYVNPSLSWRYLLLAPFVFGVAYVITSMVGESRLMMLYLEDGQVGDYYLIVTSAAMLPAFLLKNRELIVCTVLGFLAAIMISKFGGYVFNRIVVYFYVPLLFAPIRSRGLRMPVGSLVMIAVVIFLYAAALQVKLREPNNRFIPYATIV